MQIPEKTIRARIIERIKNRSGGIKFSMTTMIDIVFLLLIFFISTARFRPAEGELPMQLPPPPTGQAQELSLVEPLTFRLNSDADSLDISVAGRSFTYRPVTSTELASLSQEIEAIYAAQRRSTTDPVELDCGDQLSWEHLVKFYNLMYGMGITNITFVVGSI